MRTIAGKAKAEGIYQDWVQGDSVKNLQRKYRISRQRIYKILRVYKNVGEKDKMLRAVNKLSVASGK